MYHQNEHFYFPPLHKIPEWKSKFYLSNSCFSIRQMNSLRFFFQNILAVWQTTSHLPKSHVLNIMVPTVMAQIRAMPFASISTFYFWTARSLPTPNPHLWARNTTIYTHLPENLEGFYNCSYQTGSGIRNKLIEDQGPAHAFPCTAHTIYDQEICEPFIIFLSFLPKLFILQIFT